MTIDQLNIMKLDKDRPHPTKLARSHPLPEESGQDLDKESDIFISLEDLY